MVAPPDHLLDPRYYPKQHKEWVREEREMPGEIMGPGDPLVVKCIGCKETKRIEATKVTTKAELTASIATVLLRDKWFLRNNAYNRIEAICPRCGDAAHRHLMTW